MSYIITFLIGFIAGLLVYRRHAAKLKATEATGKSLLDVLKGR
jgi:F0F1-type ATP synthase assembly protein I